MSVTVTAAELICREPLLIVIMEPPPLKVDPVPQTIEEMEAARAELDARIVTAKSQPSDVAKAAAEGFAATTDTLDSMTVSDLKELAVEEEIDLGKASTKADIVSVIRKARLG